jgi:hypothetical protein
VRAPGVGDEGGPSSPTTLPVSPASLGGSQGHAPDLPKNDSGAGPVTASSLATVVTGDGRGRPLRHGPSADRVHEACATSRPNPLASVVVDGDDHTRRSKECEAGPGTPPNSISPNHICLRHPPAVRGPQHRGSHRRPFGHPEDAIRLSFLCSNSGATPCRPCWVRPASAAS